VNSSHSFEATRVASNGHTAVLACIYLAIGLGGALIAWLAQSAPESTGGSTNVVTQYIITIATECLLIYAVIVGIRKRGLRLRDLVGGKWNGAGNVLTDIALAFVLWSTSMAIYLGIDSLWPIAVETPYLPHPQNYLELALWLMVCLGAGFGEELTFRGYFQTQFTIISGSVVTALLCQALLFGLAHSFAGWSGVLALCFFGLINGSATLWRGNLRPAIIAHVWWDVYSGDVLQFFGY
jgi:membrane protease YdiL (CAAX protease family)